VDNTAGIPGIVDADVLDVQETSQDSGILTRETEAADAVSILVQFFGMFEISESFARSNLRISAASRDEFDKNTPVKLFFVFPDAKVVVGAGSVDRSQVIKGADLEVAILWSRLVVLPYKALGDGSSAKSILALMEDEESPKWEMKRLTSDQAITLQEAVDESAEVSRHSCCCCPHCLTCCSPHPYSHHTIS
jgi:hypothetical protein